MNALSSSIPLTGKGAPVEVGGQGRSRMRKFKSFFLKILGVAIFLGLWQFAGQWVASNPNTENFADFAPSSARLPSENDNKTCEEVHRFCSFIYDKTCEEFHTF